MKLPRAVRWRVIHWRARLFTIWSTRIHPSRLQREFNAGDPHGNVRRMADQVLSEINREQETGKE